MCEYTIVFDSKYGCPATGGKSSGRGWSFVFLVCLTVGVYLGVGIGFNRYKYGLRGLESIPNLEMWQQLPGLVRDGITFSVAMAKAGFESIQQRYFNKG